MSFIATNFVFDGIPSEELGLIITAMDADTSSSAGNDIDLIVKSVYRRPKPYFYGVNQNKVLTFNIEFSSNNEIDSIRASKIQNILFGQMTYKTMQIVQPDMGEMFINCFLLSPEIRKIGGQIVGFKALVQCDSPWAWSNEKSKIYTYPEVTGKRTDAQIFNNISANNYYSYPKIVVTMNNTGGSFKLINITDNNRSMEFTTIPAGMVLTIDNDLEILTSFPALAGMLSSFNKKWFRLLQGRNSLSWEGYIKSIEFKYINAMKIGG